MAALANVMYFMPTAIDTYVQAQGAGATPPNAGLGQILAPLTRTGATINTIAGFAYQGSGEQVAALARFMSDYFLNR
jgi:hypothetical protein